MATAAFTPTIPASRLVPPALFNACFVLFVIHAAFFPTAYFAHWWIYGPNGLGMPVDFVNVWSAGRLALEGHPALAWDWDIQKRLQVDLLPQPAAEDLERATGVVATAVEAVIDHPLDAPAQRLEGGSDH